jgi:hypothetical protein
MSAQSEKIIVENVADIAKSLGFKEVRIREDRRMGCLHYQIIIENKRYDAIQAERLFCKR